MSWAALSASRSSSRLLLCVHGVVYDVGEFASGHPGGREVLAQWTGRDATAAFSEAMHPDDAWHDMKHMAVAAIHSDQLQSSQATLPVHVKQPATAADGHAQPAATAALTATAATAAAAATDTTRDNNKHSGNTDTSNSPSNGVSPVRCTIVHGSQTGTATSQRAMCDTAVLRSV